MQTPRTPTSLDGSCQPPHPTPHFTQIRYITLDITVFASPHPQHPSTHTSRDEGRPTFIHNDFIGLQVHVVKHETHKLTVKKNILTTMSGFFRSLQLTFEHIYVCLLILRAFSWINGRLHIRIQLLHFSLSTPGFANGINLAPPSLSGYRLSLRQVPWQQCFTMTPVRC